MYHMRFYLPNIFENIFWLLFMSTNEVNNKLDAIATIVSAIVS